MQRSVDRACRKFYWDLLFWSFVRFWYGFGGLECIFVATDRNCILYTQLIQFITYYYILCNKFTGFHM